MFGAFPQGFLDHKQLMIIKGIGATPTDNNSAENPPVVVNLMAGTITLDTNGWSPNIPQTKSNGVWADSPITDGRILLAAPVANVTEQMTLIVSDASYLVANKALDSLNKMVLDCRDFWQSQYQVDPVYLAWWAGCGAGLQYALISNIEMKPEYLDSPNPTIRVSMTIEREPYWRLIPPGANPKLATFILNNQQIGLGGKVLADATLITGSDHLITATINNKFEWTPAADGAQTVPLSQNYVSISASQVPGDAPALLEMHISTNAANGMFSLYAGLSSKKQSAINHLGSLKANAYNLAAGDGLVDNGAAKNVVVAATGLLSNNSAVNYTNVSKALALGDTTYTTYLSWGWNLALSARILELDRSLYAGTFAVFLRAHGTNEDTTQKARVTFGEIDRDNSGAAIIQTQQFTDIPILVNGGNYFPHYVGQITLPLSKRTAVSLLGYGIQIRESISNMYIAIELKNSSGAARTVTILDLVLIPVDQGMMQSAANTNATIPDELIIDNTGYSTHGTPEPSLMGYHYSNVSAGATIELRGQIPSLLPKTDQRIHFLSTTSALPDSSVPNDQFTVHLNIVPRWSGIRDV